MTLLMLLTLLVFTIATGGSSDDCSATYRHEFEELEQGLETRISGMETSLLGLDNKLNLIIGKLCPPGYEFKVTERPGTYDEVKQMCRDMNGEIIHKTLGVNGEKFHT